MTSPFLRAEEVAARYGVSKNTVYVWTTNNRIPHRRLPGSRGVLFVPADLERYEAGCKLEVRLLDGGGKAVVPVAA